MTNLVKWQPAAYFFRNFLFIIIIIIIIIIIRKDRFILPYA